jgi:hypothetical protein
MSLIVEPGPVRVKKTAAESSSFLDDRSGLRASVYMLLKLSTVHITASCPHGSVLLRVQQFERK